jgi:hypothetical protein
MYIFRLCTTFAIILLCAPPASAADSPSVIITEALSLPTHLDSFHASVRAAAAAVLESGGWSVITSKTSACRGVSCAPQLARELGASYALSIGGKYRTYGYDLQLDLWDGHEATTKQATCEDCTAPELVARIQDILASMIGAENKKRALAAAIAARPPAVGRPSEPAVMLPAQPSPPALPRLLAPTLIGAAGLALLAGGVSLWILDGHASNHCRLVAPAARNCDVYETRTVGQIITGVGVAGIVAAGVLVYRALDETRTLRVSVGPGGIAMRGRF